MEAMNTIITDHYRDAFTHYRMTKQRHPLLLHGDAMQVLQHLPDASIDCVMTSPPYWHKRVYNDNGLGNETDYRIYLDRLLGVVTEVQRVLKPTGSLWLNLGDSYHRKTLLGIPWRIALHLIDRDGWFLRNAVVWHKGKGGMDSAKDRLANNYEMVFHFVKQPNGYYYQLDAVRLPPRPPRTEQGRIRSATGVSGCRYRHQIDQSSALTDAEKCAAHRALDAALSDLAEGRITDFRMILRGQHRVPHSDSIRVSGRAKEIAERGFAILRYHPNGSKPTDVWTIVPEDTQRRDSHAAPYPEELCYIPIVTTCPSDGIVLDPFCGTGTTLVVATMLGRQAVGIDQSHTYLMVARDRWITRCASHHSDSP
jgi:site-specific DNA-methyltransferase (adenine-specific)